MDGEISENFLRIISISGLLRDERKKCILVQTKFGGRRRFHGSGKFG